jgi:hypothetical protein
MATSTTSGRRTRFGFNKQPASSGHYNGAGSPTPPGLTAGFWPKWQQGSYLRPHAETRQEWEGDGQRGQGLNYKTGQWGEAKLICYPRPMELVALFEAFSGHGSKTGSATGVVMPALDEDNDYYTVVSNIGAAYSQQLEDAICTRLVISSSAANPALRAEFDFFGRINRADTALVSAHDSTLGYRPFYWFSTAGNWSFPAALFGANFADWEDAVQEFTLTLETEMTPTDYIAESIQPLPFVPGNMRASGSMTMLFQDGGIMAAAYFNGGTTDSDKVAEGDASVKFLCDSVTSPQQDFLLDIPNCSWTMPEFTPDPSGKPLQITVPFAALTPDVYTATVNYLSA